MMKSKAGMTPESSICPAQQGDSGHIDLPEALG